ncbi:hypothetical protein HMPREF1212_00166, partial [Parabacteroides sp. HGS0025]
DYPNKDEELLVFFDGLLGKQLQTYNIKLSVVRNKGTISLLDLKVNVLICYMIFNIS